MSASFDRYACSLGEHALRAQLDRYARLAKSVTRIERGDERIRVEFGADLDRDLLEATLAIERDCCPFFALRFEDPARRLEVGVGDSRFAPALDAIADQLTPAEDAVTRR